MKNLNKLYLNKKLNVIIIFRQKKYNKLNFYFKIINQIRHYLKNKIN